MDANLLHISYEGCVPNPNPKPDVGLHEETKHSAQVVTPSCTLSGMLRHSRVVNPGPMRGRNALEDPWVEAREDMFTRSVSPEQAPDKPTYLNVEFEQGDPVALDGVSLTGANLLAALNKVRPDRLPGLYPCDRS